jgi:hypothetical protein
MLAALPLQAAAQQPQTINVQEPRFKSDLLVVVAHPGDEAGIKSYLAPAIYDEHKCALLPELLLFLSPGFHLFPERFRQHQ